jgi:hypothetical protein
LEEEKRLISQKSASCFGTGHFTEAEMEIARQTDLPDLLISLGYQVTRVGNYHSTKEMDSLRIKDRRTWRRYSDQSSGDAIAFLQHFQGMSFQEAVKCLLAFHGRARDPPRAPATSQNPKKEKQVFQLPEPSADHRRVFAYLCKRGTTGDPRFFVFWTAIRGRQTPSKATGKGAITPNMTHLQIV